MQLLNSKNGSTASSFKRVSAHTPLPPSVLHACSFHPSPLFPSIAWVLALSLSHSVTPLTPHPLPVFSSVHFIMPHPHSPSSFRVILYMPSPNNLRAPSSVLHPLLIYVLHSYCGQSTVEKTSDIASDQQYNLCSPTPETPASLNHI